MNKNIDLVLSEDAEWHFPEGPLRDMTPRRVESRKSMIRRGFGSIAQPTLDNDFCMVQSHM